ncbi:AAT family amino acid transporter [Capronia coronata CBS 617.96]|uniref:AAT family amino acid transporter n=1 Tax=Capronia coronata CBS 617.96 TaxID=1182541 RepID=W9YDS7_9EURO|nr:AAT family amino acid transporter [Capronia coronata CBS 617.96]EXJ80459.1 AAT family amino acid transporter [Capronia coronata CBS 617.96]
METIELSRGPDLESLDAGDIVKADRLVEEEAFEIYGNQQSAAEYGYVARDLNARQLQFIAIGGAIGTGLFLGIGRALTQAGPLSLFLGYTVTGIAVYGMMQGLGEMATWLPLPGAIPQFCARYVDESLGFAVGWNAWYNSTIIMCAEISAASVVIQYWHGVANINVAAWISIIIVLIVLLNIFAVTIFGEAEFIFAVIKIVTLIGLLILALIIDVGGVPGQPRLGFHYWKSPGAMKTYKSPGDLGRFLGLWSTLTNSAFSYNGVEMIAATSGEAQNPRRNVPKAVRRLFWRILFFYVLGSLAIGVLVPYNDTNLLRAQASGSAGAAQSPWVIAIVRAHISALPSIVNAVILTSAASSGNALLYIGSRYLFSMAQLGQAPRFLRKCTDRGIPYWCVTITAAFSGLTYLSCGDSASVAFTWFQNLATLSGLLTWWSVLLAHLRFQSALKAQGIDRNTLVFKAPFQPYLTIGCLFYFSLVMFFNGFYVFMPWSAKDFVTCYVGLPIFVGLYAFWKILKRTRIVKPETADLHSGKQALDAMEGTWPERKPSNLWERIVDWIC